MEGTTTTFLSEIVSLGSDILDMAINVGTEIMTIPLVQVFVAITLVGVGIGLVTRAIHSMRG